MQPILRTKFIGGKPRIVQQIETKAARELATMRSFDGILLTAEALLAEGKASAARAVIRDFLGWTREEANND